MTWYCLRTAPLKEFTVQMLLDRRGISTFIPVETKWKRIGPKKKKEPISYPMVPRYIFVSSDQRQFPWHEVLRLKGLPVSGVVTCDGQPASISQQAMQKLWRMSGNSFRTRQTRVHKSFVPGDKVTIVEGAFKDWSVPVESIKGPVAEVLIPLFNSTQRVRVRLENLEAA